jgi:hypothetical protein
MRADDEFHDQIWELLVTSGAVGAVRSALNSVVILERLPRSAGATAWYVCGSEDELKLIVREFHPGSSVSFYSDDRLSRTVYNPQVRSSVAGIIDRSGDAVIGEYHPGDLHLDMQVISDERELDEFLATVGNATQMYFGAFPSPDNAGHSVVTIVLPDADGVVRSHPH